MTNAEEDSKDLMQEIWIYVFRRIYRLEDPACFPQWIYKIARGKCADWVRKQKRDRNLKSNISEKQSTEPNPANSRQESVSGEKSILKHAIGKLPSEMRVTISLFYVEELTTAEIAESLGIPIGTVKSRLFQAREKLKEIIQRS